MPESSELKEAVDEILAWVRVQNRQSLREALAGILTTANDRRIYELTDGTRKAKEVSNIASVGQSTISEKWKAWRAQGILIETDDRWKPRHLTSIESLGDLPD